MPALYYVNVTIHVLAAMLWLGGMFFLGVVGAPVLRAITISTASDADGRGEDLRKLQDGQQIVSDVVRSCCR
jgi:uncharacterized membrane protein